MSSIAWDVIGLIVGSIANILIPARRPQRLSGFSQHIRQASG